MNSLPLHNVTVLFSYLVQNYTKKKKKVEDRKRCFSVSLNNRNITSIHILKRKPVGLWHSSKHGIHTDVSDDKLLTTTIAMDIPKNLYVATFKWFWGVLSVKNNFLCVFLRNKYELPNRKCYGKKINSVLTRKKCLKMAWHSMHLGFLTCQFLWHRFWGCTFRCFWAIGLYVCIIFETAQS